MKLKEQGLQFIKFGLVGVLNTLVDFLVYQLLVYLGLHYAPAQCISYTCGLLNSYFFNSRWTFGKGKRYTKREFVAFVAVNLVSLSISCYGTLGIESNLIAKGVVTVVVMVINFIGNKLFVFK